MRIALNEITSFMNVHRIFYFLVLGLLAFNYSLAHLDETLAPFLCEARPMEVNQHPHADQDKQTEMLLVNHKLVVKPLAPFSDSMDISENLFDHNEKQFSH